MAPMAASFADACTLLTTPETKPVCYGIQDVEEIFGVQYTPPEFAALAAEVPFSDEVLRDSAGTHMLFPSAPMSLLDVRAKHKTDFYSETSGWYAEDRHSFSRNAMPVRWNLLRLRPVPGSNRKTWQEQLALLDDTEEVPSLALLAFAAVLHYRKSGQRLYEGCHLRTSDVTADGSRVGLLWLFGRLIVGSYWGGHRLESLCAAAARLPEPCASNP
jgi:hypothetical protein